MGALLRLILAVWMSVSLVACHTAYAISKPDIRSARERIEVGDHVSVVERGGKRQDFRVTALTPEDIRGQDIVVPWTQIERLEYRKIDAGKSAAAGAGGAVATYALVALIVAALGAAIAKGIEDSFDDDSDD